MSRKSIPTALKLTPPDDQDLIDNARSPLSPISPKSPRSPFRFNSGKKERAQIDQALMQQSDSQQPRTTLPPSQQTLSLPALDQYAGTSEKQEKDRTSKGGFFANYKASKSSSRLQNSDTPRQRSEDMSTDTDRPAMSGKVSSKENSRTGTTFSVSCGRTSAYHELTLILRIGSTDRSLARRPVGAPPKSEADSESLAESPPSSSSANIVRKTKPKPFSLLSRTMSIRDEQSPPQTSPNDKFLEVDIPDSHPNTLMTAPIEGDRSFRAMVGSSIRQHSEDRKPSASRDRSQEQRQKEPSKPKENVRSQTTNFQREHNRTQTSLATSFREGGGGHNFFNNIKSSATKGAGALSKGLFGKSGRSGSTNEKEPVVDDEHYTLQVINLPLVQQTRLTRISKKLEDSRDKTEFWMPAFPWRAIDYLNYKGSDVEGLYRVPGSGPQIKKWQRRFDTELDIDLFEETDLYDINIVGSMLKAWLRELPDELLPKAAQDRIARECQGSETVPQMLIDELSNLSPFNYYLLFAITCHLSLLLAHSEKNKMDFRNLCICFQPCMKMDAFCFKFLVCDWRDCWKGCKTEEQYIQQEYMLFDMIPPSSAEGRSSTAVESHDERNVSSSDSSKPSSVSMVEKDGKTSGGNQNTKLPLSQSGSQNTDSTVNTTLTVVQERTPPRMRPLSPIKPLSPIGL